MSKKVRKRKTRSSASSSSVTPPPTDKRKLITGEVWYIVSVRVFYKEMTSRTYPLFVRDTKDLVNKLKVEITKLKFIDYGYGLEEVARLIS